MKIASAIDQMSKSYLDRVIGSFARDVRKLSETQARDFIKKNVREIKQVSHIQSKLDFSEYPHDQRVLMRKIIQFILMERRYEVSEAYFYEALKAFLKDLTKQFKNKDVLNAIDKRKIEIVQTLYEVVVTDEDVSIDEERLLKRLKQKLNLTEVQFNAILHTVTDVRKEYTFTDVQIDTALKNLQWRGLVYYVNTAEPRLLVIPEEMASVLAKDFQYPLDSKSFTLLLGKLSRTTLGKLAKTNNLPTYGTVEDLVQRLWCQGQSAFELLEEVTQTELVKIARSLEVKVSGTKDEVIENVVKYFFNLDTQPLANTKTPGEAELWEYYPEIASRNNVMLRQLGLIKKDIEMERMFENLTRHAFRKVGGLKLITFSGSNNPDGGAWDEAGGSLLLWDNKSQEKPYLLPLGHHKQFLQYVVHSKKPVSSFLVITTDIENERTIDRNCIRLSGEAKVNVAVISATVFKQFIDQYKKNAVRALNIQIFNHTGVLTEEVLEMRSKAFR